MTPETKQKLGYGLTAVCLLILGYALWANVLHRNPNSDDFPDGTFWICNANGHHFNLSLKELSDHHAKHYGEPIPCPKCGSTDTIRAYRCEKCGEYYPMIRGADPVCPKCGTKPAPPS